jgi:hypothetical protein
MGASPDATFLPAVTPQVSLPPLDAEPPVSDADNARFDVRRETQVLLAEGLSQPGEQIGRAGGGGGGSVGLGADGEWEWEEPGQSGAPANGVSGSGGAAAADTDPASLESTVRRIAEAPEDPAVEKYMRMGNARDAVILGLAMMGDKEAQVLDFVRGFEQMRGMGFGADTIAGRAPRVFVSPLFSKGKTEFRS